MKFKVSLIIETQYDDIEIEAKDKDEAISKLNEMTLQDLLDESDYNKVIDTKYIDADLYEVEITAEVTNIKYDTSSVYAPKGFNPSEELPTETTITFTTSTLNKDEVEFESDLFDALENELEYPIKSCDVKIIKTK